MSQWLILLTPSRPTFPGDATEAERQAVGEHFAYLQDALSKGQLILAGRTHDEPPLGLVAFEAADKEAASNFMANDPAIANGVFRGELRPYAVALIREGAIA